MAYSMVEKNKNEFEIYNGLTDPHDFFRQFEIYSILHEWDDTKQPNILKLFLKGKAEEAYTQSQKTAYKDIKDFIIKACQVTKEQRLRQFYGRTMHDNENVRDYAQALNGLLRKAIPNIEPEDLSALVQGQLINNVPPELKPMMTIASAMGADSFNKVVNTLTNKSDKLIADLGLVKQEQQFTSEINYASTQNSMRNSNNNGRVFNSSGQYNKNAPRSTTVGTNSNVAFDGNCHKCGQYGHRIAYCPNKHNHNTANNNNNYNNKSNGSYNHYNNNAKQKSQYGGNGGNQNRTTNYNTESTENHESFDFDFSHNMQTSATELKVEKLKLDFQNNTENNSLLSVDQVELLITSMNVVAKNGNKMVLKRVLLDGGSTHSWLNKTCVARTDDIAKSKRCKTFLIEGALGSTTETCDVVAVDCELADWSGENSFIISREITKYDAVLGRDFFKRYEVKLDHGKDEMSLGGKIINIKNRTETDCNMSNSMDVRKLIEEVKALKTELANLTASKKSTHVNELD